MHRHTTRPAALAVAAVCAALALTACATTTPRNDALASGRGGSGGQGATGDGGAAGDLTAGGTADGGPGDAVTGPGAPGGSDDSLGSGGSGSSGGAGGAGSSGGAAGGGSAASSGRAGSAGRTGSSGGAAAPSGSNGRGVTADSVKVGFIVIENTSAQASNNGFAAADSGDGRKIVGALVDYVNAHGGLGGKRVDPVFRATSINTASASSEQAICQAFSDDEKVFATVPMALIYDDTRRCYRNKGTVLIDTAGFPYDKGLYDELAPYYWSPGFADYDRLGQALVESVAARGYFSGPDVKVGIAAYQNKSYQRVVNDVLKPALSRAGVSNPQVFFVDQTSLASTQQGTNSAVVSFQSSGVNRVLFVGASTLTTFFMNRAESVQYRPQYALTTYDAPAFLQLQTRSSSGFVARPQLERSIGVGFVPASDVDNDKYPWPSAQEKPCLDALAAKGIRFNTHYDSARALQYCSSLLFLKAAADKAGPALNVATYARAAEGLGTSFQSAVGLADNASASRRATAGSYRPLGFDGGCGCFLYTGGLTPFPG
jgi:hypothetical protein